MFYDFSISNMITSLKDKQVTISCSMDIDKNKDDSIVVEIFERATKSPLLFDKKIEGGNLVITFRDWPIPNSEYILGIKGITSATGEELDRSLKTKFVFNSEITSNAEIIAPAHFEKVEVPVIELREVQVIEDAEDKDLIGCYYLEIGLDNNFIDVPYKTYLDGRNTITAGIQRYGQYFLRARIQKNLDGDDIMYGTWSETITFVYGKDKEEGGLPPIIDPDDPVEEPDLDPEVIDDIFAIITKPEVGVTPESFIFEFNLSIDDLMIEDSIIMIRKDVK